MAIERISVIGAGEWGTALAQAAAMAGREVTLVGRDKDVLSEINVAHTNRTHLGAIKLSPRIRATSRYSGADLIILAVPAQATRAALMALNALGHLSDPVVLTAKGLEQGTLKRQSEILAELAPDATGYVLSGPSFAVDVAAGRPTAVTLAGDDDTLTAAVAQALAGPSFRPYAAGDKTGIELAGALKNVYALAAGAVDGAQLGASAKAGLIARAFAEMSRMVPALGGRPETLGGLAGLGDLTLSCTSTQSRNYRHGFALARGEALPTELAEGVFTAPVALRLAAAAGVDAPLIEATNQLLGGRMSIDRIVAGLMTRPLKREN
jgi:glycerol-3-phosphate dehydrogenase (NAD(P)+)